VNEAPDDELDNRNLREREAQRLAALEAADPSQARPPQVPSVWDIVDFLEWENLGVSPMQKRHLW